MYLRWKRQPRRMIRSAVVVKSERIFGKPRQQTVAYLAAIADDALQNSRAGNTRACFWADAMRRLDQLGLDPAVRERIVAQLAAVVLPPTEAEAAALSAERAALEVQAAQSGYTPYWRQQRKK